jgi:hypothetical protein
MSPSHKLAVSARIAGCKKVVLDAGWPLSDSTHNLRNSRNWLKKVQNYLIDLISFSCSSIVILESRQQVQNVSRKYFVPRSKLRCLLTGVPKDRFASQDKTMKANLQHIDKPYILFRGKANKEAGIENLLVDFDKLKLDLHLVVQTNNFFSNHNRKVIIINEFLADEEISWLYRNCIFAIGQFGNSRRTNRTIPHKFFEAVNLNIPYLTPKTDSLLSLLGEDYPFWIESLAELNSNHLTISSNYKYPQTLRNQLDSDHLSAQFIRIIEEVCI